MSETSHESLAELRFSDLLRAVASKTPSPGGGAVAAAVGALGAALGSMVVAYSAGKKSLAAHVPELESAAIQLTRARELLLLLAEADAAAYSRLNALQKLPENHPQRIAEWSQAVEGALGAPNSMLAACGDVLRLMGRLGPITNPYLKSDLAIAALLTEACARAAAWNVRINLPLVSTESERRRLDAETNRLVAEAVLRAAAIERACTPEPTRS
ncbi:MAG: cyclodeaminase/cyclohydrolase family protein [Phycisphaeraceae bacterium]|nr:cyclodeaminase/cyclohydrolase family protein [Phycisphaeraceae bacterium]